MTEDIRALHAKVRDLSKLMRTWLKIREEHGQEPLTNASAMAAHIEHSSLVRRLLSGKEPLAEPPPRNHSYPWYDLIEDGRGIAHAVTYWPVGNVLVVDQAEWDIIETVGPEEWVATYSYQVGATKTRSRSRWRVHRNGKVWQVVRL